MDDLTTWRSSGGFRSAVTSAVKHVDSEYFFSRRGKPLREAWSGARLCEAVPSIVAMRLGTLRNQWPDCEAIVDHRILPIEITEVMMPNRRRLNEFSSISSGMTMTQVDQSEFESRRRQIPIRLLAACEKKASKPYPPGGALLIYLNIGTHDWWREEVEQYLQTNTSVARSRFSRIWILWSGRMYQPWPLA